MSNYLTFLFLSLVLFSCTRKENYWALDSSQLTASKNELLETQGNDSLITQFNEWNRNASLMGISFHSSQSEYKEGEKIVLRIENNNEEFTEYYFPNEAEVKRQEDLYEILNVKVDSLKSALEQNLVSSSPAILGQLSQLSPNFYMLILKDMDSYTCRLLDYECFNYPLKSGEIFQYEITLPKNPGYNVVLLRRHTKDGQSGALYGFNKYEYSNVFEV